MYDQRPKEHVNNASVTVRMQTLRLQPLEYVRIAVFKRLLNLCKRLAYNDQRQSFNRIVDMHAAEISAFGNAAAIPIHRVSSGR